MTITTKDNAAGRISAYYVDGVKTRKVEVEGAIYEAARNGEIIYVDYYTGQEFKSLVCSCYRNMKVVLTGHINGKCLMTESAADDLGWRVIRNFSGAYYGLAVCIVEEMTDEEKINAANKKLNRFIYEITSQGLTVEQAEQLFIAKTLGATDEEFFTMANEFKTANDTDANIDDYAVSTDAQDVAIEAEENLADAITADSAKVETRRTIEAKISELKAEIKDISADMLKETISDRHYDRLRALRRELREERAALEAELAKINAEADAITAETKTVVEADVEDYAVTTSAQDVATNAEIELANNTTAATKNVSDIIAKTYNKAVSFEEGLAFMNGQTLDEYRAEKIACEQAEALATRRARLNYLPDEIKLTEEFTDRDTVLLKKMIDAFLHDIANGYTLTDADNACLNVYVNNIANGVKELHALKAELATLNAEFGNINEITTEEPANEATDAEITAEPTVENSNDFAVQLAALKAKRDAAKAVYKEKEAVVQKANVEMCEAGGVYEDAKNAITQHYETKARELSATISYLSDMKLIRQGGTDTYGGSTLEVIAHYDDNFNDCFIFTIEGLWHAGHCGIYYTPEQVTAVISKLKAAIKHGDEQFKFPTVEELNQQAKHTEQNSEEAVNFPVSTIKSFEIGKKYLHTTFAPGGFKAEMIFKVIERKKVYLTVTRSYDRGRTYASYTERYKIFCDSNGEYIRPETENTSRYYRPKLYAKDIVNTETTTVTTGNDVQGNAIEEPNVDDYTVSTAAQDVATNAEIELANNTTGDDTIIYQPINQTATQPDAKAIWERVVATRASGLKHVLTKNSRHMWFHYGGLVDKITAEVILRKEGFTIDEFLEAEKVADEYWEKVERKRLIELDRIRGY